MPFSAAYSGPYAGHIVFYCAEAELLIAGDVLFYETIGRTDFPRGNHADLINNIRNKLFNLPETVQVVAGHGRMTIHRTRKAAQSVFLTAFSKVSRRHHLQRCRLKRQTA